MKIGKVISGSETFRAAEDIEPKSAVRLTPSSTTNEVSMTTAATQEVIGFVADFHQLTIPTGEDVTVEWGIAVPALVVDGQTLNHGDYWAPSTTPGKIQLGIATNLSGGQVRDNVSGTDQTAMVTCLHNSRIL
jgi:hypothetical protein